MADYTLHEALLLSVGVEPELVPEHLFQDQRRNGGVRNNQQLTFLKKRMAVLKGHFPHSSWDGTSLRVSPSWLKDLIDRIDLDVDPEFMDHLTRRVSRDQGEEPTPPKRLAHSELESFLKLVAGMAIEQCGYDPDSNRNQAIPNIADDLDRLGIGLDLKTIRKWLKEACETVRPEKPD
jgi:hypothetical protein